MSPRRMKVMKFPADQMNLPKRETGQCATCRFRADGQKCRAFPQGIPYAIFKGKHDHRKPYEGDRGFLYEPEDK